MADWYIDSSSTDETKQIPYLEDFPPIFLVDDVPKCVWFLKTGEDCPTKLNFPTMYAVNNHPKNIWLLDTNSECPYKETFPLTYPIISVEDTEWILDSESDNPLKQIPYLTAFPGILSAPSLPFRKWRQVTGQLPMRPWCSMSKNVHQFVEEETVVTKIDWSASMQQSYEYYIVDPETWNNVERVDNIISSSITHDSTTRLFGSSNINTTEQLSENYIRTYLVVNQNGVEHKECLGTFLYMTTSDSFDGIVHTYDAIGYSPLVELDETLPPIGIYIPADTATGSIFSTTDVNAILRSIIWNYSRCTLAPAVRLDKAIFSEDIVPAQSDTWLDVVNQILSAALIGKYVLGVNSYGEIFIKSYEDLENMQSTYTYTDDEMSILLPTLNTSLDLYKIPNVVEVIYSGPGVAYRSVIKNTDPNSIVSTVNRKREIIKRVPLFKVMNSDTLDQEYFDNYAATLLEAYSTISQEISFSHGYCGTKVGDCVTIDYKAAGFDNVKGKIISQTINCTPGCTVDETIIYTKKLWNKKDLVDMSKLNPDDDDEEDDN